VVGIVLVSHSHSVAEGAAELARQMGGQDVRIETAGGLDDPERSIGTDAVFVMQAIERAWSDEGVLVLMDLVGRVSPWIALIIIGCEILIIGLKGAVAPTGDLVWPSVWGKAKANVQFAAG
jgi:PTS system fructose IIA component